MKGIPNSLKFILLIVIICFIISFIIFYGSNDLFRFPFDAGVWGNASDWVMVFGTIISLLLILRSINFQNEANEWQKKTVNIESFKHIESIKPFLNLDGNSIKYPNSESGNILTFYYIDVQNNKLLNFNLTAIFRSNISEKEENIQKEEVHPGERIPFSCEIPLNTFGYKEYGFTCDVIITYEDADYNKYRHTFNLDKPYKDKGSSKIQKQTLISKK